MLLMAVDDHIRNREAYCYCDPTVDIAISRTPTGDAVCEGRFTGIFPRTAAPDGINLRRFERICRSVFSDCRRALDSSRWSAEHLGNLKQITCAIVHWKLSSQGGRAGRNVRNVLAKWHAHTHSDLLRASQRPSLSDFCIGGVRIPIASAFLRFLRPDEFGVIDSRVAKRTQAAGVTSLSVRADGYINDTAGNRRKYHSEYVPFLREQAEALNEAGAEFRDADEAGKPLAARFRPCDVEMALFV